MKTYTFLLLFFFIQSDFREFVAGSGLNSPLENPETTSTVETKQNKEVSEKASASRASKESAQEDSDLCLLPDDLKPFNDQLAGRSFIAKCGKIGILIDVANGNLMKPEPHKREISFYEFVNTINGDDIIDELKRYIPVYAGTIDREIRGEVIKFLRIKNVMEGFESPCSMDLKIGRIRRAPDEIQQTEEKKLKYRAMLDEFGFAIPGFKYFNVNDGTIVQEGRDLGFRMLPSEGIQSLYKFVNGELGISRGLVDNILMELRNIKSWFQKQRYFRFYDSSILLSYDAKNLTVNLQTTQNEVAEENKHPIPRIAVPTNVKMIDFGRVVPVMEDKEDESYLFGLNTLIHVLENLAKLYAETLQND